MQRLPWPRKLKSVINFASLFDAYFDVLNTTGNEATINLLDTEFSEMLEFIGKDIRLVGGFKTDDTKSGLPTFLRGKVTITGGSLRV